MNDWPGHMYSLFIPYSVISVYLKDRLLELDNKEGPEAEAVRQELEDLYWQLDKFVVHRNDIIAYDSMTR